MCTLEILVKLLMLFIPLIIWNAILSSQNAFATKMKYLHLLAEILPVLMLNPAEIQEKEILISTPFAFKDIYKLKCKQQNWFKKFWDGQEQVLSKTLNFKLKFFRFYQINMGFVIRNGSQHTSRPPPPYYYNNTQNIQPQNQQMMLGRSYTDNFVTNNAISDSANFIPAENIQAKAPNTSMHQYNLRRKRTCANTKTEDINQGTNAHANFLLPSTSNNSFVTQSQPSQQLNIPFNPQNQSADSHQIAERTLTQNRRNYRSTRNNRVCNQTKNVNSQAIESIIPRYNVQQPNLTQYQHQANHQNLGNGDVLMQQNLMYQNNSTIRSNTEHHNPTAYAKQNYSMNTVQNANNAASTEQYFNNHQYSKPYQEFIKPAQGNNFQSNTQPNMSRNMFHTENNAASFKYKTPNSYIPTNSSSDSVPRNISSSYSQSNVESTVGFSSNQFGNQQSHVKYDTGNRYQSSYYNSSNSNNQLTYHTNHTSDTKSITSINKQNVFNHMDHTRNQAHTQNNSDYSGVSYQNTNPSVKPDQIPVIETAFTNAESSGFINAMPNLCRPTDRNKYEKQAENYNPNLRQIQQNYTYSSFKQERQDEKNEKSLLGTKNNMFSTKNSETNQMINKSHSIHEHNKDDKCIDRNLHEIAKSISDKQVVSFPENTISDIVEHKYLNVEQGNGDKINEIASQINFQSEVPFDRLSSSDLDYYLNRYPKEDYSRYTDINASANSIQVGAYGNVDGTINQLQKSQQPTNCDPSFHQYNNTQQEQYYNNTYEQSNNMYNNVGQEKFVTPNGQQNISYCTNQGQYYPAGVQDNNCKSSNIEQTQYYGHSSMYSNYTYQNDSQWTIPQNFFNGTFQPWQNQTYNECHTTTNYNAQQTSNSYGNGDINNYYTTNSNFELRPIQNIVNHNYYDVANYGPLYYQYSHCPTPIQPVNINRTTHTNAFNTNQQTYSGTGQGNKSRRRRKREIPYKNISRP